MCIQGGVLPSPEPSNGPNRRAFLRTAGLAGAGAATLGAVTAGPAAAASAATGGRSLASLGADWNPDPDSSRFTLAVMPDTQFLYWGTQGSVNPEPQEESFRYIIANSGSRSADNIVFMAHLGDLTEDADASSFGYVSKTFDLMDGAGAAYSVLAGNHDVSGDDTRGSTPYLTDMGPTRFKKSKTFAGSDSSGYNTAHIFRAGGREWLLLAMDWRTSTAGFDWAKQFIKDNPSLPVILTTHEIVGSTYDDNVYPYQAGNPETDAAFSDYGQTVWDTLINENDQIFLTLNGHYWPPGRMTATNAVGNDVHLHITNYQNRYFGGGGMLRLYHFDLTRNTIDVETLSPWAQAQRNNVLAAQEAKLTTGVDRFAVPVDFESRFSSFVTTAAVTAKPARNVLVPGTLAYWRFDNGGAKRYCRHRQPDDPRPVRPRQRPHQPRHRPRQRQQRPDLVRPAPPGPARARQPVLRRRPEPAARRLPDHRPEGPAEHPDVQVRVHHRNLREHPARLGLRQQLLDVGAQPLGRSRPGGQERGEHRPGRAHRHAQFLRRPGTAVELLSAEHHLADDQLGSGAARGHLVAPGRGQRRQAHGPVHRGLPDRRQPDAA